MRLVAVCDGRGGRERGQCRVTAGGDCVLALSCGGVAMESIAEGLWQLAEEHEKGGCIAQAVKCLEAICQSQVSFLPVIEVKTRLRIATLLLQHTDNVTHAKVHLERAVRVSVYKPWEFGI